MTLAPCMAYPYGDERQTSGQSSQVVDNNHGATLLGSDLCPSSNLRKERPYCARQAVSEQGTITFRRRHEACGPFRVQFVLQTQLVSELMLCQNSEWEDCRLMWLRARQWISGCASAITTRRVDSTIRPKQGRTGQDEGQRFSRW